jgi:hypothetical protein
VSGAAFEKKTDILENRSNNVKFCSPFLTAHWRKGCLGPLGPDSSGATWRALTQQPPTNRFEIACRPQATAAMLVSAPQLAGNRAPFGKSLVKSASLPQPKMAGSSVRPQLPQDQGNALHTLQLCTVARERVVHAAGGSVTALMRPLPQACYRT